MATNEWKRGPYTISTDRRRIDLEMVHGFLTAAYWSTGIPREVIEQAIEQSLVFGLYEGDNQIGLARVVTDSATFAYVCDVFVLPQHRGQGLGVWLMETVVGHPSLREIRRWMLLTRDAHNLYRRVGFTPPARPERYMERVDPKPYRDGM